MELIHSRFDISTGLLRFDPLLGASEAATASEDAVPEVFIHRKPISVAVDKSTSVRQTPVSELPGRVLNAQPGDFPASLAKFMRDTSELHFASVSKLETIDAEIRGQKHFHFPSLTSERDEEPLDVDLASSLGKVIHTVLEQVDFRQPDVWPTLLTRAVSQSSDQISESILDQASTMLKRFFESPLVDRFAQARTIYREIEFTLPWVSDTTRAPSSDDAMISGVIDVLIEEDQGWSIFDYKTGNFPKSVSNTNHLAPYELQLGLYAQAVKNWFGVVPVEVALIAFRPAVRYIGYDVTDERQGLLRQRVNQTFLRLKQPD